MCGPDEVFMGISLPCRRWGYGQYGILGLWGLRGGREIGRINLAPLFGQFDYPEGEKVQGTAYAARWPMKDDDLEREARGDRTLITEIKRRPAPDLMHFADYDHDGYATEFLLQVGTMPCGKRQYAALGISTENPHLHALASVAKPNEPLMMPLQVWQAVLKHTTPTEVPTWRCGDHGGETQTELVVWAAHGKIHAKQREYSCTANDSRGKVIKETDQ